MRVSTYELFLPLINEKEEDIKDRTILFNGLYGALDILKKEDAGKSFFCGDRSPARPGKMRLPILS